ncbi:MAG: hypothetical protein QM711_04350 [Micropruina sp.]|uniref:hypothetical protein n=1 Tax=Micropruina sp. TaxID=2737536 RepID=UPI0039E61B1B
MNGLEQLVEDALLDRDPRQSEHRVKETVASALAAFDPSAKLTLTSYFNHTYAPDMVMSWGRAERPVFLRFTDNVPELGRDIDQLDRVDPLVFGLSTPPAKAVESNHLDERARRADVLLTGPAAVEELTERPVPAATDRMLRNSLAHGGRGAVLARNEAGRLADSLRTGFDSATAGKVDATRHALATIGDYFSTDQAKRLTRVVQAVWEGGGARLDQYPGEADLSSDISDLSLGYLLQFMDTAEPAFWRGVGRGLTLDQLATLARANMAALDNFQHLVNRNLDVLRGRACLVLDMRLIDGDEPPALHWGVDLPVRETPPAVTLRGPGFHAFVTRTKEELEPRIAPPGPGLTVHEFVERTNSVSVAAVSVSVGGNHINLSADNGTTDSDFVRTTTSAHPSASVDRATVITPSGRVSVDVPQRTGTGVTRTENLIADLLTATIGLLVPLPAGDGSGLVRFLDISDRRDATDPPDNEPETLPFDE